MTFYENFLKKLDHGPLAAWQDDLPQLIASGLNPKRFGNMHKWQEVIKQLPTITPSTINLNQPAIQIGTPDQLDDVQREQCKQRLLGLHPWRKGPYDLFGMLIDTEWRSDWKWQRLEAHIAPLQGRHVLDVGCGNGYHCWRMAGAGAETVTGIDPTAVFSMQFQAIQNYIQHPDVMVLPVGIDEVPEKLESFDTVFSMGVLYHRRSPVDHIKQLMNCLVSGGELVLETLIIDGDVNTVLIPEERYACMKNVWFIPSIPQLVRWLERCGLTNVRVVDVNKTSLEEQRATSWMNFHSLKDFLDPKSPDKTIEGYPAPQRAILIANKN